MLNIIFGIYFALVAPCFDDIRTLLTEDLYTSIKEYRKDFDAKLKLSSYDQESELIAYTKSMVEKVIYIARILIINTFKDQKYISLAEHFDCLIHDLHSRPELTDADLEYFFKFDVSLTISPLILKARESIERLQNSSSNSQPIPEITLVIESILNDFYLVESHFPPNLMMESKKLSNSADLILNHIVPTISGLIGFVDLLLDFE